jgi:hypothetical protein
MSSKFVSLIFNEQKETNWLDSSELLPAFARSGILTMFLWRKRCVLKLCIVMVLVVIGGQS